ncbi:MAG: NAD(P)H-dependent oxidoreductase [Filimonas sp.]|nr:NAD(P)H-dependent oxidoreductase [Filimonas sp.]
MDKQITIAAMSGSLRKGSYNTMLLHALPALLPDGMSLEMTSIADLPLYNADLDTPAVAKRPEAVQAFRDVLTKTDAVLFVSPEYNYSIPGGLKNAIDWASRGEDSPLLHKPVSLMGVTPYMWGTVRMQLAFHPVFQFLNMKPVYKPEILIAQAQSKFDENGKLTDAATIDIVKRHLQVFKDLIIKQNK